MAKYPYALLGWFVTVASLVLLVIFALKRAALPQITNTTTIVLTSENPMFASEGWTYLTIGFIAFIFIFIGIIIATLSKDD
jgi:hypothetical protein